jgi:hypothetical protein
MDALCQFFSNKDWTPYPFIPPIFSLYVSLYLLPIYSNLHARSLKAYLESEGLGDKFEAINAVAKDRSLQVAYLSGIAAFLISTIATLKSDHPVILTAVLIIILLIGLPLLLRVFLAAPGYHSTTRFPEKATPNFIFKRSWTYLDVYSKTLSFFTILLIIVIILALPEKKP